MADPGKRRLASFKYAHYHAKLHTKDDVIRRTRLSQRNRRSLWLALSVILVPLLLATIGSKPLNAASCSNMETIRVAGAEHQQAFCLDDLTTTNLVLTGHTDMSDWITLHASGTRNPSGVPGIQIDGYFPDTSKFNGYYGWNHDAQFVMRFPDNWNGKLVITGAPGVRRQYSLDFLISDWVLARGYAFASTDKGNSGTSFYRDGVSPGDAVAEWHRRVTELTIAAKDAVQQRYGRSPDFTYITGISNGGYLTRYALENHPELYDGGVDWEGTLFLSEGPNLFTYLPTALKHYPNYLLTSSQEAHDAMIAAGFEPGSEFLWEHHYAVYWDLTQRIYREEFDPDYDGSTEAGTAFCQSGTPNCDADYDYASRPQAVKDAVAKVSLTGKIGKPMITLHGTLDALLPIRTDSDVYTKLIRKAGRSNFHRYYVIEDGTHVDSLYDEFPDKLRPILPCHREAFKLMESWVESKGYSKPPESHFVPRPTSGDLVNTCSLK
jgi:pimeloyl-ACP methyl ester carboxylesterase